MGLEQSGSAQIQSCEYEFPVGNFSEATPAADDFAMLLMAAIAGIISEFGGTAELVSLFSAVLGQEGQ